MFSYPYIFTLILMVINRSTVKCLSVISGVFTYDKAGIWSIEY
jgi:hypothetical protein